MAQPLHPAQRFIRGVVSGSLLVPKLVRLAVERHLRDLDDGHKRGLIFNEDKANRAIDFYSFLHHSKGEWAGQRLKLEDWQQFRKWVLYGWYREDGTRRFRTSYTEVPRKNGKSTEAAGDGLYLLIADGEPGAEVYSAATTRDQAKIVWSEASRMVKASNALQRRVRTLRNNISIANTASKFEPLSSDFSNLDGLNPHAALVDELHAHKDGGLLEKIRTAMGARRQPLLYYITTAGVSSENIGYNEHKYAKNVLEGHFQDDSYFAYISGADEGDDPFSPATWQKANPNYGVSIKPSAMAEVAAMAEKRPGLLNEFLRYRLNVWTTQSRRWLSTEAWDACPSSATVNNLVGQECYLGLDLANTTDIAAACWLFPPAGERRSWAVLMRYWVPEERILDRVRVDRVPYDVWARQGYITTTPGNVIDYDRVRRDVVEMSHRFRLKEAGFDPWNATQIATQLMGDGLTMVEVRQGYRTMSEPTKFFEGLVLDKAIDHGGDPVLRWMISNVEVSTDEAGNIKPAKNKSAEKIDGVVALITALSRVVSLVRDNREFKLVVL